MQWPSNIVSDNLRLVKFYVVWLYDFCLSPNIFSVLICQKMRLLLQLPQEESLMPKNEAEILKGGALLDKNDVQLFVPVLTANT